MKNKGFFWSCLVIVLVFSSISMLFYATKEHRTCNHVCNLIRNEWTGVFNYGLANSSCHTGLKTIKRLSPDKFDDYLNCLLDCSDLQEALQCDSRYTRF